MKTNSSDYHATSWVPVPPGSDFPIQNLPYGVFKTAARNARVGVALGEYVVDLSELAKNIFLIPQATPELFEHPCLNPLIEKGKSFNARLRKQLMHVFDANNAALRDRTELHQKILIPRSKVTLLMPVEVGDYTDFYSSKDHATNVGKMFRDPENALLPNWLHIPVGYHGRASSIVVSGTPLRRPLGQTRPDPEKPPILGPSRLLDFELEMAFVTYPGKELGERIHVDEAEDYIFGLCLFNDWSARDIQKWEYVPLGPFLGKNFGSSISPWIVPLEALDSFRLEGPKQEPEILDYLKYTGKKRFDINLEVYIQPENGIENRVCSSNFKHMYWNMSQQLAHHTINGCNIKAGDMMASGTISGPEKGSFGSMLEISWAGKNPVTLEDGTERKFILDHDTVIMRGYAEKDGLRIGFGEVKTKILPAYEK